MGRKKESQEESGVSGGLVVAVVGVALLLSGWVRGGSTSGGMWLAGAIVLGVGLVKTGRGLFESRALPKRAVMRLAEERGGLLTLGEIATALDKDPAMVRRALLALSKEGIAVQRWGELRKNLWEFPDYMKLPLSESIDLAKAKGGRLAVDDLLASGHSVEVARETLEALREKGLAREDEGGRDVVVTSG